MATWAFLLAQTDTLDLGQLMIRKIYQKFEAPENDLGIDATLTTLAAVVLHLPIPQPVLIL